MIGWREGFPRYVEDYLIEFPALRDRNPILLDLIDSEICVRREMADDPGLASYCKRFPSLSKEISQLYLLDHENSVGVDAGDGGTHRHADRWPVGSGDPPAPRAKAVEAKTENSPSQPSDDGSIDVAIPIDPPPWVTRVRCVSSTLTPAGRIWLVRGRDVEHGESVAMKLIPLPEGVERKHRTRILNLCEAVSEIDHPALITPRIAAINKGYLAVVRPWVFGEPFHSNLRVDDWRWRMQIVVRVGHVLDAIHLRGSNHGEVHPGNVIIDHENQVRLVDALSGSRFWATHVATWELEDSVESVDRLAIDVQGYLTMVVNEFARFGKTDPLAVLFRDLGEDFMRSPGACSQLADFVQQHLDGRRPKSGWFSRIR